MKLRFFGLLAVLVLIAASALAQSAGEATYKAKCQMCHGATGAGDTPAGRAMKVPNLKSPEIEKMSNAALIETITNGKGKMPAFKDKLTEAQIKEVVTYIRVLQKH